MKLEIDIPEHHYNNIMAIESVSLGRVPYKGIIMYAINAIKRGKVLEQEPTTKNDLAQERYQDLKEYFGDEKVAKTILESRKEFKAWLERLRWHVKKADELARELERIKGTTKNNLGVDCVSRETVKELISAQRLDTFDDEGREWANIKIEAILKGVEELPSVTPQEPKMGHWIDTNDDGFVYHRIYKCSHCGATVCEYPQNMHESKYKYCSSCGAKMVEPQESEAADD